MKTLQDKLNRYIDAGFPIIYLHSFEEEKCDDIIKQAVGNRKVMTWNEATGFFVNESTSYLSDDSLLGILDMINYAPEELDGRTLVLKDIHSYLTDNKIIALLKQYAMRIVNGLDFCIVIVSSVCVIPKELENFITLLELDPLTQEEIKNVIIDFIKEQDVSSPTEKLLKEFAVALKGLSEFEIRNILALALSENNELNSSDLELITEQKAQVIKKSGILELIQVNESIDDIGGLENLKVWLKRKAIVFKDIDKAREFGVDVPKGVLIAGMPGCGKSLNAKAAAKLFGIPLLRMDMGRLMGKYVGESEANMRKAISLAEAISPCVLWIDELEKAFAGISGDVAGAEIATRLFGTFLTWLQEKKSLAFVLATANDISKLPPELLRKGRFDEIFYVALPNNVERKKIFEIHLKKRRPNDWEKIDLEQLVIKTDGYSGADIEGVVKDSVEAVFTDGKNVVTTEDVLSAIKNTHSLSEVMKEPIKIMKEVYEKCKFKNASR